MRKLYVLLLLVVVVIVTNFLLWFAHTRTINNALSNFKKEAGVMGINVSYDDLYYTNFKSWNVEGVISNLKIKSDKFAKGSIVINHVAFISQPLKEHIELRSENDVLFSILSLGGEENYRVKFKNGAPTIEIDFATSLRSLNYSISDSDSKIFSQIKKIEYYDSGMTLFDLDAQSDYLNIDSSKVSIKADQSSDTEKYEVLITYKGLKYNPEFKGEKDTQVISENNIKRGAQNANVDLVIDCLVSETQKAYREKNDLKGAGVFDLYKLDIRDLSFSNELFKASITGNLKKYLGIMLPVADVNIYVTDYEKMLDQYISSLNSVIKSRPEITAFMPYRALEEPQIKKIKDLFGRFKVNDTDIQVHLNRTKDSEIMLSDISGLLFMTELQNILGSSVENKSAKTGLESRLEQRRAKVAK